MKLAIMQPYFLPYIGYFQLINHVDEFIILDNVNFINKGFINRNKLSSHNGELTFSLPIKRKSQNKKIHECFLSPEYIKWRTKFYKTLNQNYKTFPFFDETMLVIEKILNFESQNLASFVTHSIKCIAETLELKAEINVNSRSYKNQNVTAQDRIINICKQAGATTYINSSGGVELYDRSVFMKNGLNLHFINSDISGLANKIQNRNPYLSIIDLLMTLGKKKTIQLLPYYNLLKE